MRTVFGYLKKTIQHNNKKVKVDQPVVKVTEAVYRDELSKKQPPKKKVKKTVRFADTEPTILGEECCNCTEKEFEKGSDNYSKLGEEESGIRVKVKMTREEAARFLSKCNDGGVFELKDVALDLASIPVNRVFVVPSCTKDLI